MAKTNAQRQAEYRARRPTSNAGQGERRLNTWVTTSASLALARLAAHHGVTQRVMLEQLIEEADDQITRTLDIDKPEWDTYYLIKP